MNRKYNTYLCRASDLGKHLGIFMDKVVVFNESTIDFSDNFPDKLMSTTNILDLRDYDLVEITDYIPSEHRESYNFLEKQVEIRTNEIIELAKKEMVNFKNDGSLVFLLHKKMLEDDHLKNLERSLREFKEIHCIPAFLIKNKDCEK